MRILEENAIAVVVDYQEKLIPVINNNEDVVRNTALLIKGLKEFDIPIFISQQYTKGLGETIPAIADVLGEFVPYEKSTFGLLGTEGIKEDIKATGRNTIILCGIEAHICVLQTAIGLIEEGYNVFIVEDCIGSRKANDKKIACKRAVNEGAFLTTYESVLYEITAKAGTPQFKAISKLTK